MTIREADRAPRAAQPPRAIAWVLLLASTAAVLLTGLLATVLILGDIVRWPASTPRLFWPAVCAAAVLTILSLTLRGLRWVFLLRRAETRIPIRDAYIGYFAGLSLLFAPFLLGEIVVRAVVQRARGGVPVATTVIVNLWERALDAAALGIIAIAAGVASQQLSSWNIALFLAAALTLLAPVRVLGLRVLLLVVRPLVRPFDHEQSHGYRQLITTRAWLAGLASSIVLWLLPGLGFWLLARTWNVPFELADAEYTYASSATLSGLSLVPGGVLVTGRQMLAELAARGFPEPAAVMTVVAARFATAGVSIVLGGVFVWLHLRSRATVAEAHFDEIADAYDVQIPEGRRHALLARKTQLMREALSVHGTGRQGLDVGCGQGEYVAEMRASGFDVAGIDTSTGQVRLAARKIGQPHIVTIGSVLGIPAPDRSYDFVYVINVLHHLSSVEEQRRAFRELLRVLKPGGLLFVHEINTRNVLFRFYMGYVFPSLNCIDEGVERWLLPNRLPQYTDAPVIDIRYFTFLPEFMPEGLVRIMRPFEQLLESSPLTVFAAHYMAVFRMPG